MKSLEDQFEETARKLLNIAAKLGYGDPFASGRAREILLAKLLGHKVHTELHGPDARIWNEEAGHFLTFEYKTSFEKYGLHGRYDVSWQPTWEEQKRYLKHEKIGGKHSHYFATFDQQYNVVDVYSIPGKKVHELLLPKFEEKYRGKETITKNKISTLYAQLGSPDIQKHGKLVYTNKQTLVEFFQ